jgi:hypothetical protein
MPASADNLLMPHPRVIPDPSARPERKHRSRSGPGREPWLRLRTDVRSFFLVSLFTYACYDLVCRPILHWFAGLFSR